MRRSPLLLLLALLPACSQDHTAIRQARSVFASFQDALLRSDRDAVRGLLTRESRPIADSLRFAQLDGKRRLRVVDARWRPPEVVLGVQDPDHDDACSHFVVVREDGRFRVDLVATAGYQSSDGPARASTPSLMLRPLPPNQIARIRGRHPEAFR